MICRDEKETKKRFNTLRYMFERLWITDPERAAAWVQNRRVNQSDNKRLKYEHQCNHCKQWFPQKELQMDHIIPRGRFQSEQDWGFVERTYCYREGLQKLCKPCHQIKSNRENYERREQRKKDKK